MAGAKQVWSYRGFLCQLLGKEAFIWQKERVMSKLGKWCMGWLSCVDFLERDVWFCSLHTCILCLMSTSPWSLSQTWVHQLTSSQRPEGATPCTTGSSSGRSGHLPVSCIVCSTRHDRSPAVSAEWVNRGRVWMNVYIKLYVLLEKTSLRKLALLRLSSHPINSEQKACQTFGLVRDELYTLVFIPTYHALY